MKKPNLFIVGQHKSGTSAMWGILNQHPEIFMSKIKEPYYFCKDFHNEVKEAKKENVKCILNMIQRESEYLDLFKEAKEKVIGEASGVYMYSKVSAKEIKLFNPNSKIIIILREPVDFIRALYGQISHSMDSAKDFEEAIMLEEFRKKQHKKGDLSPKSLMYYSERVKYYEQIKRFLSKFDKKNVLLIIYDDFKNDNLKTSIKIFKFLNIDETFIPKISIINPARKIRSRRIRLIKDSKYLFFIKKIVRAILPYKIREKIISFFFYEDGKIVVDFELEKELKRKFKKEVEKTNKFFKEDLIKLWGYDKLE